MTASSVDRCRVFRQLHASGCFVIPNPWDVGSARALTRLGGGELTPAGEFDARVRKIEI